jgi:inner membrane protein
LVAVRGEVVVQFWLKPGEAAVTLGVGEEREVERIPEQLRRFLGGLSVVPAVGSGKPVLSE